jgi:hypothetical protein
MADRRIYFNLTLLHQRFGEFLSAKSKPVAFSPELYPSVSPDGSVKPNCFDVFDDAFHAQASEGASDAAVSYESEAYIAFLRSDGQSGEFSDMKNDWLRRMRLDIISEELKYKSHCDAVKRHENSGGDPKDPTFLKNKFIVGEAEKDRTAMATDTEEGHVSAFAKPQANFLLMCRLL